MEISKELENRSRKRAQTIWEKAAELAALLEDTELEGHSGNLVVFADELLNLLGGYKS